VEGITPIVGRTITDELQFCFNYLTDKYTTTFKRI